MELSEGTPRDVSEAFIKLDIAVKITVKLNSSRVGTQLEYDQTRDAPETLRK
jgi:hypothetical protein